MHSSRMRTSCSLSWGVSMTKTPSRRRPPWTEAPQIEIPLDRNPPDRDPPGQKPPKTETPLDRNPPDRDPRGQRPPGQGPPGQRLPKTETPPGQSPPRTEAETPPCGQTNTCENITYRKLRLRAGKRNRMNLVQKQKGLLFLISDCDSARNECN